MKQTRFLMIRFLRNHYCMICMNLIFHRPHPNNSDYPVPACHAPARAHPVDTASWSANGGVEHEYHSIGGPAGVTVAADGGYRVALHPAPPQFLPRENGVNGTGTLPPTDYG